MKYLMKKPETFISMLNDDIESILHKSFDNLFPEYIFEQEMKGMVMPVDIKEYEDKFVVKVELPGIDKKDISLDINKNSLKIKAEKTVEQEKDEQSKKYHKSEFRYGSYCRSLYFPADIETKDCNAELKHGILKVVLPKLHKEADETKKIEIKE